MSDYQKKIKPSFYKSVDKGAPQNQVPQLLEQAIILHQKGFLHKAQLIYNAILEKQENNYDVLHLLGVLASQSGDHQLAIDLILKAIYLNPDNCIFYSNLGNALLALGKPNDAIVNFNKAILLDPTFAQAYCNRGNALQKTGELHKSIDDYDMAIILNPDFAEAYSNRGEALLSLTRIDQAIVDFNKAIKLKHDFAEAFFNLGNAQKKLKLLKLAIANFKNAIYIKPDYVEAYCNLGTAFKELNQLDSALNCYESAIKISPDNAEANFNKAIVLLLKGDLINGFKLYEWRWKINPNAKINSELIFSQPIWLGIGSLENKTILLHHEQGYGDTFQFCRYIRFFSDLGAHVVLYVPEAVLTLLKTLEGAPQLVVIGEKLPYFDYYCPILSLPLVFQTTLHSIPSRIPYIFSNPSKVAYWNNKLGFKAKPRIGLAWRGNHAHINDENRSITLKNLVKFLPNNFQYISLQINPSSECQLILDSHNNILNFAQDLIDFSDTAALIDCLDLVISVDTSVAHLSGALGKKTWVMLPYSPDWRWLLDREDSTWYPSFKLYRQKKPGGWNSVMNQLQRDLLKTFDN